MIRFLNEFKITYLDQVLIAKCIDSTINIPNAEKMKQVKVLFLTKFKDFIDDYDATDRNSIYRTNYLELARVFAWNNATPSMWLSEKIKQYGGLTLGDRAVITLKKAQSNISLIDALRYYFTRRFFSLEALEEARMISSTLAQLKGDDD